MRRTCHTWTHTRATRCIQKQKTWDVDTIEECAFARRLQVHVYRRIGVYALSVAERRLQIVKSDKVTKGRKQSVVVKP